MTAGSTRMIPLAQRFAAAEPGLGMHIDEEERSFTKLVIRPDERYLHKFSAYALVREWAGANRLTGQLKANNHPPTITAM
jgi:hypothetical protein